MLATDGHFTFLASKPQLACAAFVIAEPSEVISLELHDVDIDCSAGDFIKVRLRRAAASTRPTRRPELLRAVGGAELQQPLSSKFISPPAVVSCWGIKMM